jgi:hypothetical protein
MLKLLLISNLIFMKIFAQPPRCDFSRKQQPLMIALDNRLVYSNFTCVNVVTNDAFCVDLLLLQSVYVKETITFFLRLINSDEHCYIAEKTVTCDTLEAF